MAPAGASASEAKRSMDGSNHGLPFRDTQGSSPFPGDNGGKPSRKHKPKKDRSPSRASKKRKPNVLDNALNGERMRETVSDKMKTVQSKALELEALNHVKGPSTLPLQDLSGSYNTKKEALEAKFSNLAQVLNIAYPRPGIANPSGIATSTTIPDHQTGSTDSVKLLVDRFSLLMSVSAEARQASIAAEKSRTAAAKPVDHSGKATDAQKQQIDAWKTAHEKDLATINRLRLDRDNARLERDNAKQQEISARMGRSTWESQKRSLETQKKTLADQNGELKGQINRSARTRNRTLARIDDLEEELKSAQSQTRETRKGLTKSNKQQQDAFEGRLSGMKQELASAVEKLRMSTTTASQELTTTRNERDRLRNEKNALKVQLETSKGANTDQSNKVQDLKASLKSSKQELSDAQSSHLRDQALNTQLGAELGNYKDWLKASVSSFKNQMAIASGKDEVINEFRDQLSECHQQARGHRRLAVILKRELSSARQESSHSAQALLTAEKDSAVKQASLDQCLRDLAAKEERSNNLSADNERLKAEEEAKAGEVETLDAQRSKLPETVHQQGNRIQNLGQEIAEAKTRESTATDRLLRLQAYDSGYAGRLDTVEQELGVKVEELSRKTKELVDSTEAKARLQSTLETERNNNTGLTNELKSSLSTLNSKYKELKNQHSTTSISLSSTTTALNYLRAELAQKKRELSECYDACKKAEDDRAADQEQTKSLITQLEQRDRQLDSINQTQQSTAGLYSSIQGEMAVLQTVSAQHLSDRQSLAAFFAATTDKRTGFIGRLEPDEEKVTVHICCLTPAQPEVVFLIMLEGVSDPVIWRRQASHCSYSSVRLVVRITLEMEDAAPLTIRMEQMGKEDLAWLRGSVGCVLRKA